MEHLIQILQEEQLTCLVQHQDQLYKATTNGIQPLLQFIEWNVLQDSILVDKVIGKAAAMLMVYGGVKRVHANVVSLYALQVFHKYRIPITYEKEVAYIINRKQDGMCPMEECVLSCDDPSSAYQLLKEKASTMTSFHTH